MEYLKNYWNSRYDSFLTQAIKEDLSGERVTKLDFIRLIGFRWESGISGQKTSMRKGLLVRWCWIWLEDGK